MSLICDCKSLMEQDWEVQAHHIYCEANGCTDALAKRGAYQHLLSVYSTCHSFVYLCYVRNLASLGINRLCARGMTTVGVVWTLYYINKSSRFHQQKKKTDILGFLA